MSDSRVQGIKTAVVEMAGGYLRNPGGSGTCASCFTPTASRPLCPDCSAVTGRDEMPDALGFLTYAGYLDPITQSGTVMRNYKNPFLPSEGARRTVALLAALGLLGHPRCPGVIVGSPVTAWATVPSLLPKRTQPHRLNDIVRQLSRQGSTEIVLQGAAIVENPRAVNGDHYTVIGTVPANTHVLLIEDTWASGGHALSAALALSAAGTKHVSLLVLARWLSLGWEATTTEWAKNHLATPDYDADRCPWTQADCP